MLKALSNLDNSVVLLYEGTVHSSTLVPVVLPWLARDAPTHRAFLVVFAREEVKPPCQVSTCHVTLASSPGLATTDKPQQAQKRSRWQHFMEWLLFRAP